MQAVFKGGVQNGSTILVSLPGGSYMAAVQWHPEFHRAGEGTLDDRPLLDDFVAAARATA